MKTANFIRKVAVIFFVAEICLLNCPMQAQTIQIDSVFISDGEIFPFQPNDTIYGLSISGAVTLLSDTSLVRVILTDNSGNEWMVYEAYPLINPNRDFEFVGKADETMYRQVLNSHSLKILILNASIHIDSINILEEFHADLPGMQATYKESIESSKVDSIRAVIRQYHMIWFAHQNDISNLSYSQKTDRFGEKFNLLGLDYYIGGIYDKIPGSFIAADNSDLIDSWDWRSRHGAIDPLKSNYYFDPQGNGWLTSVKNQMAWSCSGLCYIYGPLATIEGLSSLYFNNTQLNYDLSEQHVLECDNYNLGQCDGGANYTTNNFAKQSGILDELCYPRIDTVLDCQESNPSVDSLKHYQITISDTGKVNTTHPDSIKVALIKHGPLEAFLENYKRSNNHGMVLIGYGIVKIGDIIYGSSYYSPDSIIIDSTSNYIGDLYWIFKNSYGSSWGDEGYAKHFYIYNFRPLRYIKLPIDDILSESDTIRPWDKDKDGYWNWGISPNFDLPIGVCSEIKDSDDSEGRIGPFDSNYYGIDIHPEIQLELGLLNGIPVSNGDFVHIDGDPQQDNTFTFVIRNPGTAQLNLYPYELTKGKVTVEYQNYTDKFQITKFPERSICMDSDTSTFKIKVKQGAETVPIAHIHIHLFEPDMDSTFEFTLIFNGCNTSLGNDTIDDIVTWNAAYQGQNKDLYLSRTGELTITGIVLAGPDVDFFVDQGGKLILDGGTITGSCQGLWNGIDVWGNDDMPQTNDYQGMVQMINGGMIEFAKTAIETAKLVNIIYYPSGGIITCRNAIFRNNITDIKLYPYNNRHPVTHDILPNQCSFSRTQFETTDNLYNLAQEVPNSHLLLDGVGGINLWGCVFANYATQTRDTRGMGIQSNASGYFVTRVCGQDNVIPCPDWVPCRFENLDYGIRAFNSNSLYTITVNRAEFTDNYRGIYMSLCNDATMSENQFEFNTDDDFFNPGDTLVGIYAEKCERYQIEENDFTGLDPEHFELVGMHILNSGPNYNELYNNNFENLDYGIIAAGENRNSDGTVGLCIKCNDFTNCTTDVIVTHENDEYGNPINTDYTGIAIKQGIPNIENEHDSTLAAGNTFSEVTSPNYFNNDYCGRIDYTYQGNTNSDERIRPENNYGDVYPEADQNATYTKSGSCPSHLGGSIILSLEKGILSVESSLISSYKDTLFILIDGGNTEGLNYDVLTSVPEEVLVIRQNLIDLSPYLSDTVMISAIEKEDVFPNSIVRDILVQNPQASKSKKIINVLDERQDTIPDYMVEEIMQGLNIYGAKEFLEQKLGEHIVKRDRAWNNLVLCYKNDTANVGASIDSLMDLYQNENRLNVKYDLAYMYLDQYDSTSSRNVLDNILSGFNLTSHELSVHNHYQDLFDVLRVIKYDSIGLDSVHILTLFDLSKNNQTLPGINAKNVLIVNGLLTYSEPVYLADPLKSEPIKNEKSKSEIKAEYLKVYPNPAGNYFIAQYNFLGQQNPGILTISDFSGKALRVIQLKNKQNQIFIPTEKLAPGSYIIELYCGTRLLDFAKLIISK